MDNNWLTKALFGSSNDNSAEQIAANRPYMKNTPMSTEVLQAAIPRPQKFSPQFLEEMRQIIIGNLRRGETTAEEAAQMARNLGLRPDLSAVDASKAVINIKPK